MSENPAIRLRRLQFRAWHRGTREADYLIGGFFDACHAKWNEPELAWFDALLDEEDHDIMAWALRTAPVPETYAGAQMTRMQLLDYVSVQR